jgi:prepilin-type N-terminal cleavage/methylation domain-containing protein
MTHPRTKPNRRRPGLSLLEVLVALAIFLFSMVAISRIVIAGSDRAIEARYRSEAVQICQQVMTRLSIGELPLSSQSDTPLDEDPDWHWSVDAEQGTTANGLWTVTVKASRAGPTGTSMEYCSLSQMLLDPSMRGSSFDTVTVTGTSGGSGGGSGGGGGGGGTGGGGSSTPSGSGGAVGGGGMQRGPSGGGAGGGGMQRGSSPAMPMSGPTRSGPSMSGPGRGGM